MGEPKLSSLSGFAPWISAEVFCCFGSLLVEFLAQIRSVWAAEAPTMFSLCFHFKLRHSHRWVQV